MIVPKKTHHGNGKVRHGSKDLKNKIDKNSGKQILDQIWKNKERLQSKNPGEINWGNQRNGHKYFHQNTSTIEVSHSGNKNNTKDGYYYKNINNKNNDGKLDSFDQVSYSSAHEDYQDGLDLLEDPKQTPKLNAKPNGFGRGSAASKFETHYKGLYYHLYSLFISTYIIVCM